jgi:WS/DGAT/MGAT family acyltransferase
VADRLSALDAAYLNQDARANPLSSAGLSLLDPRTRPGGLRLADVRRVVADRLHLVPRLRQRIQPVPGQLARPLWVDDPDFDLVRHVRPVLLPPPGDERSLADLVEQIHWRPVDKSRPLWELYFVEGLADGRCAILMRFHHALADGMSAMYLAGTLLRDVAADAARPWRPAPVPAPGRLLRDALEEEVTRPVAGLGALGRALSEEPQRVLDRAGKLRRAAASFPRLDSFVPGPFNVPVGAYRRFAMTPLPVAALRPLRAALRLSVHELVLTLVAGALGHLLAARGGPSPARTLRVLVPTSARGAAQRVAFGNEGSLMIVELPVGPLDERLRAQRIRAELARAGGSGQSKLVALLREVWEHLPAAVDPLLYRYPPPDSVHLVVSYMRGTRQTVAFDGARHLVTYPVPPLAPRLALTVAVAQIGGVLGFGFVGDWEAVPDLDVLPEGVRLTLARLQARCAPPEAGDGGGH